MDQQIRQPKPIDPTRPGRESNRAPIPLSERSSFKTLGQGVAICSLVGVISDLLTPINDGEILNYVLCAAIASLAFAMVARRKFPAHRMDIDPVIAALLIGVFSLGGLKLVHVFYGTQNGLIADASPMTKELQQSFFRFEGKLIEIGRNLEGVQTDTTAIRETTDQINSRTERIEGQTQQAKRETSEDPRKELANRGIPWSNERFREALRSEDVETISLFLESRFNWSKMDSPEFVLVHLNKLPPEIFQLLAQQSDQFSKAVCSRLRDDCHTDISLVWGMMETPHLIKALNRLSKSAIERTCGSGYAAKVKRCVPELRKSMSAGEEEAALTQLITKLD